MTVLSSSLNVEFLQGWNFLCHQPCLPIMLSSMPGTDLSVISISTAPTRRKRHSLSRSANKQRTRILNCHIETYLKRRKKDLVFLFLGKKTNTTLYKGHQTQQVTCFQPIEDVILFLRARHWKSVTPCSSSLHPLRKD